MPNFLKRMMIPFVLFVLVAGLAVYLFFAKGMNGAVMEDQTIVTETVPAAVDSVTVPVVTPSYVVLPGSEPLTQADRQHLFEMLPAALDFYNSNPDVPAYRHARAFDTYVYQLLATKHRDGTRIVQVIALPPDRQSDPEWGRAPIITRDGGAGYFEATVNLDLNLVSDIFVHGEA